MFGIRGGGNSGETHRKNKREYPFIFCTNVHRHMDCYTLITLPEFKDPIRHRLAFLTRLTTSYKSVKQCIVCRIGS